MPAEYWFENALRCNVNWRCSGAARRGARDFAAEPASTAALLDRSTRRRSRPKLTRNDAPRAMPGEILPRPLARLELIDIWTYFAHAVRQATVGRYLPRRSKAPSRLGRSFLRNHLADTLAIDTFIVTTATFRILYTLIVLERDRRKIVHFDVTENLTQVCLSHQITEALPWDTAPWCEGPSRHGKRSRRDHRAPNSLSVPWLKLYP